MFVGRPAIFHCNGITPSFPDCDFFFHKKGESTDALQQTNAFPSALFMLIQHLVNKVALEKD